METLDTFQGNTVKPVIFIIFSGVLTHLYFKRYEPQSPIHALSLLLGIPCFLSLFNVYVMRTPASTLSTPGVLRTFVVYFTALIGSIVAYRLSPFHPLAKYPGPSVAKLSKLWMFFVSWTGRSHEYYAFLHEKYGDIVRTGPNEVMIRDPTAILPLMGTTGWGKSALWSARTLDAPIPPLIGVRDGPEHAKRRRTWNRGFTPTSLKEYEPMVHKRVLELLETIAQHSQMDLCKIFSHFMFDVMTDMALGGGTELLVMGDPEGLTGIIEAGMRTSAVLAHMPWLGRYVKVLPGVGENLKRFRAFAMERLALRKNAGSQRKDLFYHLSDEAGIEKQPIPVPITLSDSTLVIVGGSETTSTILSSLFFYLMRDPKKFEKLRAEIDKFYPRGEITTEHFGEMHYLGACINETLRLSPPIVSGSQRSVLHPDSSRGKMLGPYYIPEGNSVSINFLGIQRDPRNFSPNPNTFWPDRWLIARNLIECPVPEGEFAHNTTAFVPFSFGPGGCVGKPLAMLELRMTTAYLVRDLDFKFAPGYGETWESDWRDYFAIQKGKLPTIATPRA